MRRASGSFRQNALRHFRARISDSHFKQPANKQVKAPPPLFSQGAGSADISLAPRREGAERRKALVRNAAPRGPSCDRAVPPAGGNRRPITRTGAPRGAPLRRFSFVLGTAFWKRTGAAIRNALDSTGFPPLSSAPPARCRTDHVVGRAVSPRPPEIRLRRPDPQAPHPFHHLDASRWRLTLERTVNRMPQGSECR